MVSTCFGQEAARPGYGRKEVGEYGPFLSCTLMRKTAAGKREVASLKGVVIKLPNDGAGPSDGAGAICFDTDLLCVTSAWTGDASKGLLDLSNTMMVNHKGTDLSAIEGSEIFRGSGPGWANPAPPREDSTRKARDRWTDPRPDSLGPLPRAWGRYLGLYVHDDQVVVSYEVGGVGVLETFGYAEAYDVPAIVRTVRIDPSERPLRMLVAHSNTADEHARPPLHSPGIESASAGDVVVTLTNGREQADLHVMGQRVELHVAPHDEPLLVTLTISRSGLVAAAETVDPATLIKGGRERYPQQLAMEGQRGDDKSPYVLDRLPLPDKNPGNSWMRLTAFDFFADGRAAVSTLNGDVWLVSGIDGALKDVNWKRFATGLYEPMGLTVVDGKVHVLGRDQITRLHDLNGDGEADFYENFNNAGVVNPSYHGFAFELQTDSHGNFYYARTGHRAESGYPGHGCVIRVSKDGKTHEVIATGLRAPNGLAVGPADEIAVADNQGNWVPTTRIDVFKPTAGREVPFLGYLPQHHGARPPMEVPPPMCWIPHKLDPSAGSAVWVTGERWGPFAGNLAHTSFGRASLLMVLPDTGYRQAAMVRMPLNFDTGIMRAKFNPVDGQLYVAGLGGGWQSGGPRDGGFYRVRYTGKPVHLPTGFGVEKNGVRLTFADRLDREIATDPDNYGVERWNYKWTDAYGSLEYSVNEPEKKGRDEVEVKSVTLSEDGKSLFLELADFKPAMQMLIQMNIEAADGTEIETEVYATVNQVAE